MTDPLSDPGRIGTAPPDQAGHFLPEPFSWLDSPLPPDAANELPRIYERLVSLSSCSLTPLQRAFILERFYARSLSVINSLRPLLTGASLPPSRKVRQLTRGAQDVLKLLAENLLAQIDTAGGPLPHGRPTPPGIILWRSLHALAQHLLIGSLVALPAGNGIWQELHRAYHMARRLGVARSKPDGAPSTPRDVYFSAILLGCAQPASFTSGEIDFLNAYVERFSDRIDSNRNKTDTAAAIFWIDPARDAPATPCSRKAPPPETPVRYFSCSRLAELLKTQLSALEAGTEPQQLDLPDFAATPAGQGVLRRLITYWGAPVKRRFTRRRQNRSAVFCVGLNNLWRLFQDKTAAPVETSHWIITNESPDGYAAMHVSGKTDAIVVGDIVALRTENAENWQVCIVRWAQSENQEHLELGVQILSNRAEPAVLALPDRADGNQRLPVLVLPIIPAIRPAEMLVAPSGILPSHPTDLVLVLEKDNIEVRELGSLHRNEQNSRIDIYTIESRNREAPISADTDNP